MLAKDTNVESENINLPEVFIIIDLVKIQNSALCVTSFIFTFLVIILFLSYLKETCRLH